MAAATLSPTVPSPSGVAASELQIDERDVQQIMQTMQWIASGDAKAAAMDLANVTLILAILIAAAWQCVSHHRRPKRQGAVPAGAAKAGLLGTLWRWVWPGRR